MTSGPLRRALRSAGHHLDPVVQVGKEGLTDAVRAALDEQLLAHELVKVKVGGESPEDRFEVAARLSEVAGAGIAQILGHTVLVYRRHPERPRFEPWGPGEAPPPKPLPDLPARQRGRHRSSSRKAGKRLPRGEQRPGHYKRMPDDGRKPQPQPRSDERPGNFGKRPPRSEKRPPRAEGRPPRGEKRPAGGDRRPPRAGGTKRPYVKRGR